LEGSLHVPRFAEQEKGKKTNHYHQTFIIMSHTEQNTNTSIHKVLRVGAGGKMRFEDADYWLVLRVYGGAECDAAEPAAEPERAATKPKPEHRAVERCRRRAHYKATAALPAGVLGRQQKQRQQKQRQKQQKRRQERRWEKRTQPLKPTALRRSVSA
jgi:hypothetical protein